MHWIKILIAHITQQLLNDINELDRSIPGRRPANLLILLRYLVSSRYR